MEGNRGRSVAPLVSAAWWKKGRLVAIGSVAATVIGATAIVVPLAVAAGDRQSSPDTIEVHSVGSSHDGVGVEPSAVVPVEGGLASAAGSASTEAFLSSSDRYAVPVDAPWEEFWSLGVCGTEPAASAWLREHGRPILPYELSALISNEATAGSAAVVSDIRAQGQLSMPPVDTVIVGHEGCKGGHDEGIFATMVLGVDPVAVYSDCYTADYPCGDPSGAEAPVPGDPVVFEVLPGQTRNLHLKWTQAMDFVGRFVATVTVDGTESTVDLSPDGVDLDLPAVTRPDPYLYIGSRDGVVCTPNRNDPATPPTSCTLADWLAILDAA